MSQRSNGRRTHPRGESGQASSEFLAVSVVAAVLVTAVILAFTGGGFGQDVRTAVCSVKAAMGGAGVGCTADGKPIVYEPDLSRCLIASETDTVDDQLKIFFFTVGDKYTFMEQKTADGKIKLTYLGGKTVGVTGSTPGFDVKLGDFKLGAGADGSATLGLNVGDTYILDNDQELKDLKGKIDAYEAAVIAAETDPDAGLGLLFAKQPRDPDITYTSAELTLTGNGTLGLGTKDQNAGKHAKDPYLDPNIGLGLTLEGGSTMVTQVNNKTGEKTNTYTMSGSGEGKANWVVGSDGKLLKVTGSLSLTYDKDGKLTRVTMMTAHETTANGSVGGKTPWPGSEKANGAVKNGQQVYQTDTVYLDVTDANRAAVEAETGSLGNGASLVWDALTGSIMPSSVNAQSNDFQRLLYTEGQGVTQYYTGDTSGGGFDLEAKFGFVLGIGANWASTTQKLVDAQYLGAPGPDGTRTPVPFTACTAKAGG